MGGSVQKPNQPAFSSGKLDKIVQRSPVPAHCDQPNLVLKSKMKSAYQSIDPLKIEQNDYPDYSVKKSAKNLPFPYLQNLLDGIKTEDRFSKKMTFEYEPKNEYL